ncbi:MAG: type IV pilus twitching motility protein PilT [Candidatus Brocadiia bacterium]
MVSLETLLLEVVKQEGSDLHITVNSPPRVRISGRLVDTEHEVLTSEDTKKLIYSILDSNQIAKFEKTLEMDMSFGIEGIGRFRVNVFRQRGMVGAVMRLIPTKIKTFDDLGLPRQTCERICNTLKGLVLVTGATGSGKSTTLAAMVDYVNTMNKGHILTIEDPVEYVHNHKGCLVNQREVGSDTLDFKYALKSALRQDPDVVLIGEMRDMETTEAALTISETGHLAFATLHTSDAVQTINRIIDIFPSHQQSQVRTQLSFTLQAVFSQQLLPKSSGKGRVLASEVMIANSAVRSLIRDSKTHQMYSCIQTGGKEGMSTMNQSLFNLYKARHVTFETILEYSSDPEELKRMVQKGSM